MTQQEKLERLKLLLPEVDQSEDDLLSVYLSFAEDIICDLRNSNIVEPKYDNIQIKMALELYSKRGAEGQLSHGENGISRGYDKTDISIGLLEQVTPVVKTPYSSVRVIE